MRTVLLIIGTAAFLVAILLLTQHNQRVLESGLPQRIVCANEAAAREQAGAGAIPVLGTGSMAPYIPAAPAGTDPLATVCAYAVPQAGATFNDIAAGKLVVYAAEWKPGFHVIHGAAQLDGSGWIMSGLHNARSESWARVTPTNFRALVARVYVWPTP
jgi:hypothetical protein